MEKRHNDAENEQARHQALLQALFEERLDAEQGKPSGAP
jgi:hypothetical protein